MIKNEREGMFIVSYDIGRNIPGAPLLQVNFGIYTPEESLSGPGRITQTTHPPLDINTKLEGSFTYMTVMPKKTHILIKATGYPPIQWPAHGGVGPAIMPNVQLTMVIDEDWKSGTATYKYRTGVFENPDEWITVKDVPVNAVPSKTLER